MKLLRSGLLVAVAVVGLAVVAQAQDSPQRKELRRVDLSGAAGMEVVSSISEFKPGEELPRHLHHGVEAGYVVQGAMVQNPGQQPAGAVGFCSTLWVRASRFSEQAHCYTTVRVGTDDDRDPERDTDHHRDNDFHRSDPLQPARRFGPQPLARLSTPALLTALPSRK